MSDCTSEHGAGHPDCPKCWHRSPRNPNAVILPDPVGPVVDVREALVLRDGDGDLWVRVGIDSYPMPYVHKHKVEMSGSTLSRQQLEKAYSPVTVEHSIKIRGEVVE